MAKPLAHVDTEAREPFIIIDGKKYPLSGAIKNPGGWSLASNFASNYNGTMKLDAPYRAPEGFTFQTFALKSGGFTHVSTDSYDRESGKIECRVYQGGHVSATVLELIGWRLVSMSTDPNRLQ